MRVMNKLHQPSLRAIAAWQGCGGHDVQCALITELDATGFMCRITQADGTILRKRIHFTEPIGGDISPEAAFIDLAKVATDALSSQMTGETERDMLVERSAQLLKGKTAHTVTLNCAAFIAKVSQLPGRASAGVVQTLRHVGSTASISVVCRPGLITLLRALQVDRTCHTHQGNRLRWARCTAYPACEPPLRCPCGCGAAPV